ncbi:S53 family peptidase [Streptomyces natalensis]|uniref:Protease n=1 Tax=Streptomyces natalensis ATCC 27448 TaxID=1240678 RepID=A0A0D7CHY7_9ACTN|nr:S53 family peptidase [Streptomyces natalensis]KIZ15798.1 protease [Streptomyces natalensis ATCC 27448]
MPTTPARRPRRIALATAAALAVTAPVLAVAGSSGTASAHSVVPKPASAGHVLTTSRKQPLPTSECRKQFGADCYGPTQYQAAYNTGPLLDKKIDGRGKTIAIVDAFGSPTIQHDLDVFDKQYGLPATKVDVQKWGKVPPFDPKNHDMTGWAGETTLDVEYAHAMAPGAKIKLIETGVSETEGSQGLPEMMDAVKDLAAKGSADIVSFSLGASEDSFAEQAKKSGDYHLLKNLRYGLKAAAAAKITVLGASGDDGATDYKLDGKHTYAHREVGWPASDPLVTAVGGTRLHLDDQGKRLKADEVWSDAGGGVSRVFGRPGYQDGVKNVTGAHRGLPDISMSADPAGGAWVYSSYDPSATGWEVTGGTSQATPMFAGIVALADQAAGKRLGNLNEKLYELGARNAAGNGVVDVTRGDNSAHGVKGYRATKGYDLASGWGTLDAARLAKAFSGRH